MAVAVHRIRSGSRGGEESRSRFAGSAVRALLAAGTINETSGRVS